MSLYFQVGSGKMSTGTSRRQQGFTLIELLVVIAIIAILAAILFPVFAQAREKARQTQCINNQKQMATAVQIYTQENEETMPEANTFWADIDVPAKVKQCPTAGKKITRAYGYNSRISGKALGEISDPVSTPLTADTNKADGLISLAKDVAQRHQRGFICSLADGHVEYVKDQVLYFTQWAADYTDAASFTNSIKVLPDSYSYSSYESIPLAATYNGTSRSVTKWDALYYEIFSSAQPVYSSMKVGYTYLFEVTLSQPNQTCTGLNVIFGANSSIGAESPIKGYLPCQRLPNAINIRQGGGNIYGSTDWDGNTGPAASANTNGDLCIAVTPIAATDSGITYVNLKYYFNGKQWLWGTADGGSFTCALNYPVSIGLFTYAGELNNIANWPYTVITSNWQTRIVPARN